MSVTTAEFWRLLHDSRLLAPDRFRQVRAAVVGASPSLTDAASAAEVAQRLLQDRVLTRYQAELLLNGRAGPFRYGAFRIEQRLRGGRLRGLFRAWHEPTAFPVLLRFAGKHVAQDPRQWSLARQYHRQTTALTDPNVQRVFALEDSAGYRFLVLEDLVGESLGERMTRDRALAVGEASWFAYCAARGLAAIHQQQQTYGDLRPANVWLDPTGEWKLLRDWVLPPAVPDVAQMRVAAAAVPQAAYAAPELSHPGTPLSPRTDVYALGCTLYELLTGSPPFAGTSPAEILECHATAPVPSLEARGMPRELAECVTQMLAKDPRQRTASAAEVAEQVAPFVVSERTSRVPPHPGLAAFESALSRPAYDPPAPPPIVSHLPDLPVPPPVTSPPDPPPVAAPVQDEAPPAGSPPAEMAPVWPVAVTRPIARAATRVRRRRTARRRRALLLAGLALGMLLIAVALGLWHTDGRLVVGTLLPGGATVEQVDGAAHLDGTNRGDPSPLAGRSPADQGRYEVVGDDGQLPWMTPTQGAPLPLSYVPSGTEFLVAVRASDLASSSAGQQLLHVLGPQVADIRERWESAVGCTLDEIDHLVIGWRAGGAISRPTCVVWLRERWTIDQLLARWDRPSPIRHEGVDYYTTRGWSFFVPTAAERAVFVMGDEREIREVALQGDTPPLMRREMVQLWQASDQLHLVTLLAVPDFVRTQVLGGGGAFGVGPARRARLWLESSLGDDFKACQLGLHIADYSYAEFRGCGQTSGDSLALAESLRARLRELPDRVEAHFAHVYPAAYWRRVALRVPEMIRVAAQYARVGVEDEQVILNVVLPGSAAHNLMFAATMLLDETADSPPHAEPRSTPPPVPQSLDELLQAKFSVRFPLQSLEFALQDVVQNVRTQYPALPFPFEIEILGQDLQREGITRNQQIADFHLDDRPLAEILTTLLMRANPVPGIADAADPNQKLIWVSGPDPRSGMRQILLITTRGAAAQKGYVLPSVFRQP